ncbi:MAG: hypothetical protein ACREHV_14780 [Rhizomicrobium sp.]
MNTKQLVKQICLAGMAALAFSPALAQIPGSAGTSLSYDTPTAVNGVESVCTGTGESDENNLRWATYSVKVVLAGKGGQYLAGATVTLSQGGKNLVTVSCNGPWILFKVAPGRYHISAVLNGETQTGDVYAQQSGQGRVIIRFIDRGGTVSPDNVPSSQPSTQQ